MLHEVVKNTLQLFVLMQYTQLALIFITILKPEQKYNVIKRYGAMSIKFEQGGCHRQENSTY